MLRELEEEDAAIAEAAAQAKEKKKGKNKNKGKNKVKGNKEDEKKEEEQQGAKEGERETASSSSTNSSSSTSSSTSSSSSSSVAAVAAALSTVALIPDEEQEGREEEQQKKKTETVEVATEPDEDFLLEGVPENFLCQISLTLMTDPVVCMDQHTYNRSDLEEWFATCRRKGQPITSPTTNAPMGEYYMPTSNMKSMILEWREKRTKEWRETGGGKMKG